jgi:hypothetical protein
MTDYRSRRLAALMGQGMTRAEALLHLAEHSATILPLRAAAPPALATRPARICVADRIPDPVTALRRSGGNAVR